MTARAQSLRRVVVIDENDRSRVIADGPSPEARTDPARPGYVAARIWATDRTPVRLRNLRESLDLPHTLEPPPAGSVCRVVTFPPDAAWKGKVGAKEVRDYFAAMGSPRASTYSPSAPHPYMQKTRTLEFCAVLDGEATLVLDTQEVKMAAGDVAILRGANHAWSNRSTRPARVAIASHAAAQ